MCIPQKTMVLLNLAGAKLLKFKSDRFSSTLNSNVLLAKKTTPYIHQLFHGYFG
jgi:hypothetical protein